MDGRIFRKLCVFGCLTVATVGCKSKQQSLIGPMPENSKLVNMPVGGNTSKSFWDRSKPSTPTPTMPVEVAPEVSKKPASAASLCAMADVQLDAAFDERTLPGSKEALLDSARKGYQKALQQEPKSKDALRCMARFYSRVNEHEKSVEMYKKYLTLYPKDADVAHEVAIAHARWKDWPGAVAGCEFTLKIDPENRSVKKTLGFCQAMAGKWDEAFSTLCQIMPEAQARHNLAGMLDQLGHTEACKAQLQLALKADPNFVAASEFLTELSKPQDLNAVQPVGGLEP
jgi:tetratricopeptide (TPR) repeat protein